MSDITDGIVPGVGDPGQFFGDPTFSPNLIPGSEKRSGPGRSARTGFFGAAVTKSTFGSGAGFAGLAPSYRQIGPSFRGVPLHFNRLAVEADATKEVFQKKAEAHRVAQTKAGLQVAAAVNSCLRVTEQKMMMPSLEVEAQVYDRQHQQYSYRHEDAIEQSFTDRMSSNATIVLSDGTAANHNGQQL